MFSSAMDAGSAAPSPTEKVLALSDEMARAAERLEADFSKLETKIHRFPRVLRGIGGDGDRYIVPSVMAIGPYHRGLQHLQKMEEVKLAAANCLCLNSGHSTVEVYEKVLSVAGAARGCYDTDDPSVTSLRDADFADMMFLDGCFLMQYIIQGDTSPVLLLPSGSWPSIHKDILLLDNQIPWLVLDALAEFVAVDVQRFVHEMGAIFLPAARTTAMHVSGRRRMPWGCTGGGTEHQYKPPHLLGLLRFTQVGSMPAYMVNDTGFTVTLSISAVELAQIGVSLAPSMEPWFGDMRVRRGLFLFGELSLSPLFLNDVTACWLVNTVALEASTAGATGASDGYIVSSYLSVLAMLMDSDDDVQQLRAKRVLYGTFSNKEVLRFFKGLARHLRFGGRYGATLEQIESYKRHRTARIAIHKLLYNSFKAMTIAMLFSIMGVLIGIFKTLLDNKKH